MVTSALGCGATTALRVPCEIPLDPTQPVAVFMFDHSNELDWRSSPSPNVRMLFDERQNFAEQILPFYRQELIAGALSSPPRDGGGDLQCEDQTRLDVRLGSNQIPAVVEFVRSLGPGHSNGHDSVISALPVITAALQDPAYQRSPRFIVLIVESANLEGCVGGASREQISLLAQAGLPTVVIGLQNDPPGTAVDPYMDSVADAGGYPRDRVYERFYHAQDHAAIRALFDRLFLPPYYCHLHARSLPPDLDRVQLVPLHRSPNGLAPPRRDSSRQDGWDWTDADGSVELFGPACSRATTDREQYVLQTLDFGC